MTDSIVPARFRSTRAVLGGVLAALVITAVVLLWSKWLPY